MKGSSNDREESSQTGNLHVDPDCVSRLLSIPLLFLGDCIGIQFYVMLILVFPHGIGRMR